MFKINLVPEVKQQQLRIRRVNVAVTTTAIITAVLLLGIGLLMGGYVVTKKAQIALLSNDEEKLNSELKAYGDLEQTVASLESGLKEVENLISGDNRWIKVYGHFEKATPADIRFSSLKIDPTGAVTATVEGKDVKSIDRFIRSFSEYKVNDKNIFSGVDVNGYTKSSAGGVSFSAKMMIDEGAI